MLLIKEDVRNSIVNVLANSVLPAKEALPIINALKSLLPLDEGEKTDGK